MKIKLLYYLILFTLFSFLNQCKKDYPDDIPLWVKNEIKEYKKTSDNYDNGYKGEYKLIKITEYTINNEKIYGIGEYLEKYGIFSEVFYDYNKENWCLKNKVLYTGHCKDFIKNNYSSFRLIWEEQEH